MNIQNLSDEIRRSPADARIYIGSDSKQWRNMVIFGLVVAIHYPGSGGASCYAKKIRIPKVMALTERLLKETELAVNLSMELQDILHDRLFEIHLDINPDQNFKSNQVMATAVGWIESLGWAYRIKPDCYGAYAADNLIR